MQLIMLIPWILAITWTIWTHHFIITSFLIVSAVSQFFTYKKGYHPRSWGKVLIIMQFGWLTAAYFSDSPFIAIGMLFPLAAFMYIGAIERKQQVQQDTIIRNYEQQLALMDELRRQRHDFKTHASALLHANGRDETIQPYKSELQGHYADVDQILKSESNIVAGALFAYYKKAQEHEIELYYHIQHAISGLPLSEYELISLVGNILDNAIDASSEYQSSGKQGKIFFSCRKQSGIWIVVCQNSTIPLQNETIERIFTKRSQSTKGGTHEGIGTQQIMNIVKKHEGVLDFAAIEETFTLKIKIPDVKVMVEQR